ncbi:hypothetical protein CBR_g53928 [Chara braunii]|uniref:Uncharacterized protein n=1 Tax=Chara braunii TaxID=69332 RepID=A0A388MBN5_CHABU|nr:hypothetical protein CBR_g53928 [Chara braunii]|eukprot:GBG91869.1 hypothetical protein CBR_g53928 [Chara braunii]
MASHGRGRSASASALHGEERRGTTSSPARETSRGVGGGEEERRAQNLWCDYSKRVWYLDWASQDSSDPLQPPCGALLFVAVRADRTRLAGSIVQWVDDGKYNFKLTLKKHYKSDGSVDGIAKGCKVAGRMFGGWPRFRLEIERVAPGELQTELSQEREASGNVAGEEEVSEQGLFRKRSAEKTQSGGKRNLPDEKEREGLGALKRQRKVGGSARTPITREGGSVEKRKRVGGGDETPKDSSIQRRTRAEETRLVREGGRPVVEKGQGEAKERVAEEKTFYVQVPEQDVHCWKELVDLMDREKKRLLNSVLNLNIVWVQTSSKKLAEQEKFSVKEMVDTIKMDRIMLRLWHYMEFEYEEMDKREWNANSTFFRSKKQLFEEFKDRGLNDKLWNESKKFFTDTTYVNKCPQFLGCQHDNNIKRTAPLINDQHFPAEWKRVVLSVVTGDRAKGKKKPQGVDECINIMWTRTSALTTLAQFNVDLLSARNHNEPLGKLGHQLRSHTCVLDLCGAVDRAQWDSGAFASLSELLGFVCQDYWTLVVFVPCLWNLSFMTCLSALGATRCYTGKWVRKTASKKTHQFGNSVWEEPDVMHILFKGEDPRLQTHPVYEGAVAEDDVAALRRKQKVTPTDVEEKSFKSLTFADIGNLT